MAVVNMCDSISLKNILKKIYFSLFSFLHQDSFVVTQDKHHHGREQPQQPRLTLNNISPFMPRKK